MKALAQFIEHVSLPLQVILYFFFIFRNISLFTNAVLTFRCATIFVFLLWTLRSISKDSFFLSWREGLPLLDILGLILTGDFIFFLLLAHEPAATEQCSIALSADMQRN